MTHPSEERLPERSEISATTARVLPFERPQSELQKAVQQRAQETIDRERDRARQKGPAWRRVVVLALAAIPVVITFGAAVGFVGALRQFNTAVFDGSRESATPTQQSSAPAATSEPGVVLLQPYDQSRSSSRDAVSVPAKP